MKTAAQIALEEAEKRKGQEVREKSWQEQKAIGLAKLQRELQNAISNTLYEFATLPECSRLGNTLRVKGFIFELYTEYVTGTMKYNDDSPEVPYENYVIRWKDQQGRVYGGCCTVENFNKQFGRHMAQYL